jgi:hypothetical protein
MCACARFRGKRRDATTILKTSAELIHSLHTTRNAFTLCAVIEQSVAPASSIKGLPPIDSVPMYRAGHALLFWGSCHVL